MSSWSSYLSWTDFYNVASGYFSAVLLDCGVGVDASIAFGILCILNVRNAEAKCMEGYRAGRCGKNLFNRTVGIL